MPIYSKSLISNMALGHCGVTGRIEDVDNENSPEAINCRLFYDHIVALILETCWWPFATVEDNLVDVGSPPDEWGYRYKKPVNCRLIQYIKNPVVRTPGEDQSIPFVIRDLRDGYGECILTDMQDAVIVYNDDVTDPGRFAASFAQAVSLGVAAHIAMPIRVDVNIVNRVQQQFTGWLAEAINKKQREQKEDTEPQSQFYTARG